MEIERKWMVTGWPTGLEQTSVYNMDQGYISVRPTVRIRREALQGGRTALVLCFKGEGGLSREEIETEINAALFARLEHLIGKPLIHKERRGYQLPGGLTLEVNCVDPDLGLSDGSGLRQRAAHGAHPARGPAGRAHGAGALL